MADTAVNSYEEIRKKRVQENLKHLEELGISKITKGLLEVAQGEYTITKCRTSPKSKKMYEMSELRRSSRTRNPVISYHQEENCKSKLDYRSDEMLPQVDDREPMSHRRSVRRSMNGNAQRAYTGRIASSQQIAAAIKRAEKLQRDLKSPHPSFVKSMLRSHVSSCFWLGLPTQFCKDNLRVSERRMVLEDEEGKEYDAIYIGQRTGLSGGWRGFSLDHNLEDGDALIFELAEPTKFKIYIIKAIREDPSETTNNEAPESTAAPTTVECIEPEEDLSVQPKHPQKTASQPQGATKRKRKS